MPNYTVYEGRFVCHDCKVEVKTLRMYYEQQKMTWMCRNRHLTEVSLNTRKKKRDYERTV